MPTAEYQTEIAASTAWIQEAICTTTDPEIFFTENPESKRAAKQICSACPVKSECLEDALIVGDAFGIRGGLTAKERVSLLRKRRYRRSDMLSSSLVNE